MVKASRGAFVERASVYYGIDTFSKSADYIGNTA